MITLGPLALSHHLSLTPEDLSHWEAVRGVKMSDPCLIYATFHLPASPGASDASLDGEPEADENPTPPPLAPNASLSGVELGELLGITDADVSDVLVQLDQTGTGQTAAECEAAFSHAVGGGDLPGAAADDAAADDVAVAPPASASLDGLHLEVSFEPHSTDGDERLVIKGRKLDVFVRLLSAACAPARRSGEASPRLQLGITLIYEDGAEVEDLVHAGLEPLIEVLDVQQPWTDEKGDAKFEVKLNVLSSMRRNALFRLCVFPAEVALCQARPDLCATTEQIKTLCKKPKASSALAPVEAAESSRTTSATIKTQCKKPKVSPVSSPGRAEPSRTTSAKPWALASAAKPPAAEAAAGAPPLGAPRGATMSGCSAPGISRLDSEADRLAARVHAQVSQIESLSASNSALLEELARLRSQLTAVGLPLGSPPSARMPLRRKRCT